MVVELLAKDVPLAKSPDGKVEVKVIAGRCYGTESAVFTVTPSMYLDVRMKGNATFQESIPSDYNAFAYVLDGSVRVGPNETDGVHGTCLVFGPGDFVEAKSGTEGARFVLIAGQPLGEPVVQHGPFVMNTREQIMQAFRDFSAGKF